MSSRLAPHTCRVSGMRLAIVLATGMALALPPRSAHAAWPHNPAINLPLCTAANEQSTGVIASDLAGGAYVAWQDFRNGSTYDIYAQHVLASGVTDPTWPANGRPVCSATNNQQVPCIVSDGVGGAIVAWADLRGGATFDIYAQHLLTTGVDPAWPADGRALSTAAGSQVYPQMVSDGNGGAIVTWQDARSGINDIYAQHVNAMGFVDGAWPVDGRALCTATGPQTFPTIATDGAGGAIVVWTDGRLMVTDIYAQHVQSSGVVDPAWPVDGRGVCTATNTQQNPAIETDGSGGAYIAWEDYRSGGADDIYVSRVLANSTLYWASNGVALCLAANSQINPAMVRDGGTGVLITWQDNRGATAYDVYVHHVISTGPDASWPGDGRALCTAAGDQNSPSICSDGSGGALVGWQDVRTASGLYAQHVSATGGVDGAWPVDGRALCLAATGIATPRVVTDGAGGAIACWTDSRAANQDIYAQRVARFSYLGTPEAVISSVTDVPNDNGGKVKVSWDPSWLDTESDPNLSLYEVWRSVPGSLAQAAIRAGATLRSGFAQRPAAQGRTFVAFGAQAYWEYLGSQSAVHYIPGYAYLAPTTGDSTGAYNPKTAFMVVARNVSASMYWLSAPASGYSVDNVAPFAPAPFTGQYGAGSAHLHWDPNAESDLAGYRLYRGTTPGFTPGPGSLVATPPDTGYVDAAAAPFYYKLSAVDTHGNESGFTTLLPSGALAVEDIGRSALALAAPSPNPAARSATLRWSLPRSERVSLAVYDAGGRRLRSLVEGTLEAGEHSMVWDLCDDRGAPVASGLCFVRLLAGDRVLVRRIVRVR